MNDSATKQSPSQKGAQSISVLAWIQSGYRLEAKLEQSLEPLGLSLAKLNVITLLAESRQSLALSEIAAKLQCVRSNVTQLIDRLEADGLVRRLYDPADRRLVRAELTDEGRRKQAFGASAVEQTGSDLSATLSQADIDVISRVSSALK